MAGPRIVCVCVVLKGDGLLFVYEDGFADAEGVEEWLGDFGGLLEGGEGAVVGVEEGAGWGLVG